MKFKKYFCTALMRRIHPRVTTKLQLQRAFSTFNKANNLSVPTDEFSSSPSVNDHGTLSCSPHRYRVAHKISVYVKALKAVRKEEPIDTYNTLLLTLFDENPHDIDALYILLHGNSRNSQLLGEIYEKAKRSPNFTNEVAPLCFNLQLKNKDFPAALKIYKENSNLWPNERLQNLFRLAPTLDDVQSLWKLSNETGIVISPKINMGYISALVKFDYDAALSFIKTLSPTQMGYWVPLFEIQGNLRSPKGINHLIKEVRAQGQDIKVLYKAIFIAIAKCFPEKVLAIIQKRAPFPSVDEESTKLLSIMTQTTVDEMMKSYLYHRRSVWEIPLVGFLHNKQYEDVDKILNYTLRNPSPYTPKLCTICLEHLMNHDLIEKALSLLDEMMANRISKVHILNGYHKLLDFVIREQMDDNVKIVKLEMSKKGIGFSNFYPRQRVKVEQSKQ